jgi:hypothetical protein
LKRNLYFNILFSVLGGSLLLFIVLPLISILLGTTPQTLWSALIDPEVLRSIGLTFGAAACGTARSRDRSATCLSAGTPEVCGRQVRSAGHANRDPMLGQSPSLVLAARFARSMAHAAGVPHR